MCSSRRALFTIHMQVMFFDYQLHCTSMFTKFLSHMSSSYQHPSMYMTFNLRWTWISQIWYLWFDPGAIQCIQRVLNVHNGYMVVPNICRLFWCFWDEDACWTFFRAVISPSCSVILPQSVLPSKIHSDVLDESMYMNLLSFANYLYPLQAVMLTVSFV